MFISHHSIHFSIPTLSTWPRHKKNHHLNFFLLTFHVSISFSISIFFSSVLEWFPFFIFSDPICLTWVQPVMSFLFWISAPSLSPWVHKTSFSFKCKRTHLHFLLLSPLADVHFSLTALKSIFSSSYGFAGKAYLFTFWKQHYSYCVDKHLEGCNTVVIIQAK